MFRSIVDVESADTLIVSRVRNGWIIRSATTCETLPTSVAETPAGLLALVDAWAAPQVAKEAEGAAFEAEVKALETASGAGA